jgi:hypothetical protein
MESNRGRGQGSLWTVAPTEEEEHSDSNSRERIRNEYDDRLLGYSSL